jgi:AcrR family transcriptional regulator
MKDTNKKTRGRPRSIKSHQAMLESTLKLLGEVGYEAMTIEAISADAGVGKSTIYRRYQGKEELVADAIESMRQEVTIPNTGSFQEDIDELINNAAQIILNQTGKQTAMMIINSASSSSHFAKIYERKYLQPRRKAFRVIIKRAKTRKEVKADIDPDLVFDTISGIMLYAQIFSPVRESWSEYIHRSLNLIFQGVSS